MIPKYKKIGNVSLAVAVTCFVAIGILGRNSTTGNVWGPGGEPHILMYGAVLSIVAMFWAYAKSKGHSGWLGILLPFLNIIGLVVLLKLKDKHPDVSESHNDAKLSLVKGWTTYIFIAAGLAALAYVIFVIKTTGA